MTLLHQNGSCCDKTCEEPVHVSVPGPQGAAGLDGVDGVDGADAYTTTTGFVQPAVNGTVNIVVANSAIAALGVDVFVETGGYYEVTAIPDATHLTLENLGYTANAAPAAVIPNAARVRVAGEKGLTGDVNPNGALLVANDLSDLNNADTALGNLGGTTAGKALVMLTNPSAITFLRINADNTVTARNAANFRADLSLAIGTNVQAFDADLTAIAALVSAADRFPYSTGAGAWSLATLTADARTLLAGANFAAMLVTLGRLKTRRGLLGSLTAVNMNAGGDTLVPISATRYRVDLILLDNTSATLAVATAGVFTGAGGIGTVAADQTTAAATAANKYVSFTLSGLASTDILTGTDLYFRVGTPAGIAATANIWVFGEDLS